MPLTWHVHNLSKQQAEQLVTQLDISEKGTLDDIRKHLKEKCAATEACLPSLTEAKMNVASNPIPSD
jgi:hypothetical protein